MDFGGGDEIRFERRGLAGLVTLTRSKALNALTLTMVEALSRALTAWEVDPGVALVIIMGEGRAFSAGGDILQVYESGKAGRPNVEFFAQEYRLNAQIARFRKPYVALIDGIVMGGGVGISCHGSHRVMTENALFAMPEVGIGFFPDVGASHILPHLDGSFGLYLALTGNRIRYGDAVWSGLATHAAAAASCSALVERLCETGDLDLVLAEVCAEATRETGDTDLSAIARHFSRPTLAGILRSVESEADTDPFAAQTLSAMLKRSPTSLAVTFRQLAFGLTLSMDDCMRMEFRILNRMLAGHDFYEGIRAALIDKGSVPEWRPASLDAVDEASVQAYFAPLPDGDLAL